MKQGEKELLSPEQFDEAVDELKKASLDTQALKSFLLDFHPADIAQMMAVLPLAQSQKLLAPLLATKKLAATLIELPENYIEDFLADLPKRLLADVVTELEPDDAVDLLQYLDKKLREQILGLLTKVQARELRKLLYYGEDTAGALMDPRCLSLLDSFTVQEAIDAVRANRNRFESIYYVYIVDRKRNLVGIVKVSNLLFVSPRDELSSVMHRDLKFVYAETPSTEVAQMVAKYDIPAVPVLSEDGKLLGRITVDDVIDVIEEASTKEVYQMSSLNENDRVFSTPLNSTRLRLPWLVLHFFTALLATFVISRFEETLRSTVVLAALMPIVAGMGGNAGAQTLTVIIRGLALGELQKANRWRAVWKETAVGVLLGLLIGGVGVLTIGLWKGSWLLGGVLAIALIANLSFATIAASLIPLLLKKLNIDPALASTTLLTTLTDACGFLVFLSLAKFFLASFQISA